MRTTQRAMALSTVNVLSEIMSRSLILVISPSLVMCALNMCPDSITVIACMSHIASRICEILSEPKLTEAFWVRHHVAVQQQ